MSAKCKKGRWRLQVVSSRREFGEEPIDLAADFICCSGEIIGESFYRSRAGTGVLRRLSDTHDLGRGVVRTAGRNLNAAGDFLGRCTLLGHSGGDRAGDFTDLTDSLLNTTDGLDRALGCALHSRDLRTDLIRRLGSLRRQRLDLAGYY